MKNVLFRIYITKRLQKCYELHLLIKLGSQAFKQLFRQQTPTERNNKCTGTHLSAKQECYIQLSSCKTQDTALSIVTLSTGILPIKTMSALNC